MSIPREPYAIFAACYNFYVTNKSVAHSQKNTTIYLKIKDILTNYLSALSILNQAANPAWTADADHPGYLIRIDPPVIMRVPYHMVCAFPSESTLDSIWRLSRKIKFRPSSVICLSGSATLLKASTLIADIDFCEYVRADTEKLYDYLNSKTEIHKDLIFVGIKAGALNSKHTMVSDQVLEFFKKIDPYDQSFSHALISFIGKPENMRPTKISNMLIFCDEQWSSASLMRTFAAQEALLDATLAVPNNMCDPHEIGRYVFWLYEQAVTYLKLGNYTKTIKRCHSLSRLCFLNEISEEITKYIQNSIEFFEEELFSLNEIISETGKNTPFFDSWSEELTTRKSDIEADIAKIRRRTPNREIKHFSESIVGALKDALSGQVMK